MGGTIVTVVITPLLSLKNYSKKNEIHLNNDLIFKDMEKQEEDHINLILNDDVVLKQWIKKYDKRPSDKDVDSLFDHFSRIEMSIRMK